MSAGLMSRFLWIIWGEAIHSSSKSSGHDLRQCLFFWGASDLFLTSLFTCIIDVISRHCCPNSASYQYLNRYWLCKPSESHERLNVVVFDLILNKTTNFIITSTAIHLFSKCPERRTMKDASCQLKWIYYLIFSVSAWMISFEDNLFLWTNIFGSKAWLQVCF